MRQRRTWAALCLLLAAAAAAALAGCTAGGCLGGEGSVECDPSPTITSAPTTVATAGTGYGYLATGYYFCFLGLSFSIEGVELPTGASVSSPVVTWTPGPDQAGRVLIVDGNPHLWCELYDPAAGTFSITGAVKRWRPNFAAAPLPDGRVLVAGDVAQGTPAEVYDPETGLFTDSGAEPSAGALPVATSLGDGTVLVTALQGAEVFDPAQGVFRPTGGLWASHGQHTATRLLDGRVLVVGGSGAPPELYTP